MSAFAVVVPDNVGVDEVGSLTVGFAGVVLLPPPLPTVIVAPGDGALSAALGAVEVTVRTCIPADSGGATVYVQIPDPFAVTVPILTPLS